MFFNPPLKSAYLTKRYKRFLADAITPEGEKITLHCANTGAMTGCAEPGSIIWYSTSTSSTRKYPYSWELTETNNHEWICINTHLANKLVNEAIKQNSIIQLTGYDEIKTEVSYGSEKSRIDLLLIGNQLPECYVEIKSVTLNHAGQGFFPDTVTMRGQKHLRELIHITQQGKRAILFFLTLHSGIQTVSPAFHIDKQYADLFVQAIAAGVEILCYKTIISPQEIIIDVQQPLNFYHIVLDKK